MIAVTPSKNQDKTTFAIAAYALEKAASESKNQPEALASMNDKAIANLRKAIELNPKKYLKICQNDSKFNTILEEVRSLALTQGKQ